MTETMSDQIKSANSLKISDPLVKYNAARKMFCFISGNCEEQANFVIYSLLICFLINLHLWLEMLFFSE